jgi:O-6-methylguanine DNA methyltransferase
MTLEAKPLMARLNDNLFTTLSSRASPREKGAWLMTRFGWMQVCFTRKGLTSLVFADRHACKSDSAFRGVFLQWLGLFQRADAPTQWGYLDLGGTKFQRLVWRELLEIPFGGRTSYGAIAAAIGRPKASRAVGSAVGANPVSILLPCHRVLPATGLSGNYRWGAQRKRALLEAEQDTGADLSALFEKSMK